jgi:hypothetical protein
LIVDLGASIELLGIHNNSHIFIGSKAAAAAAAAEQLALREQEERRFRETSAIEQKRRHAIAIEGAIPQLNAMFSKTLRHLDPSFALADTSGGGVFAAASNLVTSIVELDELLQDLCVNAEQLVARVPELKSVENVVEPCLQRLLQAINKNREECSTVWLDDATPRSVAAFNRCVCEALNIEPRVSNVCKTAYPAIGGGWFQLFATATSETAFCSAGSCS